MYNLVAVFDMPNSYWYNISSIDIKIFRNFPCQCRYFQNIKYGHEFLFFSVFLYMDIFQNLLWLLLFQEWPNWYNFFNVSIYRSSVCLMDVSNTHTTNTFCELDIIKFGNLDKYDCQIIQIYFSKSSPKFCCHLVIRVPIIAGLECQGHSQVSDGLLMMKMKNSEFGNF